MSNPDVCHVCGFPMLRDECSNFRCGEPRKAETIDDAKARIRAKLDEMKAAGSYKSEAEQQAEWEAKVAAATRIGPEQTMMMAAENMLRDQGAHAERERWLKREPLVERLIARVNASTAGMTAEEREDWKTSVVMAARDLAEWKP